MESFDCSKSWNKHHHSNGWKIVQMRCFGHLIFLFDSYYDFVFSVFTEIVSFMFRFVIFVCSIVWENSPQEVIERTLEDCNEDIGEASCAATYDG